MKHNRFHILYDWETEGRGYRVLAVFGFAAYYIHKAILLFTTDPTFGPSGITRRGK